LIDTNPASQGAMLALKVPSVGGRPQHPCLPTSGPHIHPGRHSPAWPSGCPCPQCAAPGASALQPFGTPCPLAQQPLPPPPGHHKGFTAANTHRTLSSACHNCVHTSGCEHLRSPVCTWPYSRPIVTDLGLTT